MGEARLAGIFTVERVCIQDTEDPGVRMYDGGCSKGGREEEEELESGRLRLP